MKFVDSFLEFLSHSKVIHLKRDILQRRSGLSGTISRIWAVSGLVGENRFNKNQSSRTTEQKANFDPRFARFEQNYQILAPADILPLALAFVFVRRPLGRAMLVCVFVFVLYLSLPFSWNCFPLTFV